MNHLGVALAAGSLLFAQPARAQPEGTQLSPDLSLRQLASDVWVHTSKNEKDHYPANGMLVRTRAGSILIDLTWNDAQAERLLDWAEKTLHAPVKLALVTHAHGDRMGGIRAVLARGIEVRAISTTRERAQKIGLPAPGGRLAPDEVVSFGGERLQTFFPGPGHAPDNLVVWLPRQQILFTGCLTKAADAKSIGNIADADLTAWTASLAAVEQRFKTARMVVPGHGEVGEMTMLAHTKSLIAASSAPAASPAARSSSQR